MIHGLEKMYRPPRLGVVRLGIKIPNASGTGDHPAEVRYFVLPDELKAIFGAEPTRLSGVRFPFNEPEKNLHSIFYERRSGRLLTLRCDGVEAVHIPVEGRERTERCQKDADDPWKPCPCGARAKGRLSFIVPKAKVGIYEVALGGFARIGRLLGELKMYQLMLGRLVGVPFIIERTEVEENYRRADGTRAARKGYPVRIISPFSGEEADRIAGAEVFAPAALTAGTSPSIVMATPVAAPEPIVLGEPPEHEEDDAVPEEDEAEWDISFCFKVAAKIGVSAQMYERYLLHEYGVRSGDVTDEQVRRERSRLENPGDGRAVKLLIAQMALTASGGAPKKA
jgi:hypothetical protein